MNRTYRIRKNYPAGWYKYLVCDESGRPVYAVPNLQTMHDEVKHLEKSGHKVITELNKYPDVSDLPGRTKAEKVELYLKKVENDNRLLRKFGYIRVSTVAQAAKGNSLEEQKEELEKAGVNSDGIYKDVFTGTTTDRPELNKLLDILKDGDTLIVTKLDRIARSVSQGSELIQTLIDRGVHIKIFQKKGAVMTIVGKYYKEQNFVHILDDHNIYYSIALNTGDLGSMEVPNDRYHSKLLESFDDCPIGEFEVEI